MLMQSFTELLSGNPLTRFAGAPPEGEHLTAASMGDR